MTKKMRTWVYWAGGIVVVVIAAVLIVPRVVAASKTRQAAVAQYLAESVETGSFEGTATGSGSVGASSEATIQAPQQGAVSSVAVHLGQTVAKGATVAMMANGTVMTAPIGGTVVAVNVVAGDYVSAGQTLVTVADMKTLYANITVPEQEVTAVKVGQSATLVVSALPGRTFNGTVTAVGQLGSSASGSVSYPVTIKIASAKGILLGMSVDATIDTATLSNATYVPTAAIENINGVDEVMVPRSQLPTPSFGFGGGGFGSGFDGGRPGGFGGRFGGATKIDKTIPVAVKVTVGLSNATDTQILSGLSGATQVLVANPAASNGSPTPGGFGRFGADLGGGLGFGG